MHKKKSEVLSYKEKLEKDKSFIWTIKKDWYDLDFKYLKDNSNSIFFKNFIYITDVHDYLDYFPEGAFEKQVKYITNYYVNEKPDVDRTFIYLTEEEMDKCILNITEVIDKIWKDKKINRYFKKESITMKKLPKNLFNEIKAYMNKEARLLENAIFNYYFNDSNGDDIVDMLEEFQNTDGGFGRGIEPDFKLMQSSPMATSIGLRHLSLLDNNDRVQKMIIRAIEYLESTFNSNRYGWYSVPSSVNDYPHALWWEYKSDIDMTVIDYSWGNPTAELIGYLYKYREYLANIDIYPLMNYAIASLNECTEFNSEHEIFCYIRMYNTIDEEFSSQIEDVLKSAISQLINVNEAEWTNYVPTPLKFIEFDSENLFGINRKFIDQNLDYLIDELEEYGKIQPTWQWDDYLDEWEIARTEWMGILTLEALLSLLKFNRL